MATTFGPIADKAALKAVFRAVFAGGGFGVLTGLGEAFASRAARERSPHAYVASCTEGSGTVI